MLSVDVAKALANERRLQILGWLKTPRAHFPPQVDGDLVLLFTDDAEGLHAHARQAGVPIRLQAARAAGLEDVFLRLTGRRLRD